MKHRVYRRGSRDESEAVWQETSYIILIAHLDLDCWTSKDWKSEQVLVVKS